MSSIRNKQRSGTLSNVKIEELDGRQYAKEALLNSSDRAKLFVEAQRLNRAYQQNLDTHSNLFVSESDDSRFLRDHDASSHSDADYAWRNNNSSSSQQARLNRIH
jgi:hypothetical protein